MDTETTATIDQSFDTPAVTTGDKSELPITILPELETLLPSLSSEEKAELHRSIEAEGVRDNLLVWRTVQDGQEARILIDGHNRYRITETLGRPVSELPTADIGFADMEEAKTWIIANQLMRRNMPDEQRAYFRAAMYEAIKGQRGGNRKSKAQNEPLIGAGETAAEKVAHQCNVSVSTIKRSAAFAKRVDALPLAEKIAVLAGKMKLPRAAKSTPQRVAENTAAMESPDTESGRVTERIGTDLPPRSFTVADIPAIILSTPDEVPLLVFRVLTKAQEYIESLSSVTPSEHTALVRGVTALRGVLSMLVKKTEEMTTTAPESVLESGSREVHTEGAGF